MSHFHEYRGVWDDSKFGHLIEKTGFTKQQLNKWFWDRKKKEEDSITAKKISYPGLIFTIMDTRNGKDLTPSFKKLFEKQIIFAVEKVKNRERMSSLNCTM